MANPGKFFQKIGRISKFWNFRFPVMSERFLENVSNGFSWWLLWKIIPKIPLTGWFKILRPGTKTLIPCWPLVANPGKFYQKKAKFWNFLISGHEGDFWKIYPTEFHADNYGQKFRKSLWVRPKTRIEIFEIFMLL